MHWSEQTPSSNNKREDSTHGHHHMVTTEIRLILFFAAKDGEALYSQRKQDQELTVSEPAGALEQLEQTAVAQRLPHEHQPTDELLGR